MNPYRFPYRSPQRIFKSTCKETLNPKQTSTGLSQLWVLKALQKGSLPRTVFSRGQASESATEVAAQATQKLRSLGVPWEGLPSRAPLTVTLVGLFSGVPRRVPFSGSLLEGMVGVWGCFRAFGACSALEVGMDPRARLQKRCFRHSGF